MEYCYYLYDNALVTSKSPLLYLKSGVTLEIEKKIFKLNNRHMPIEAFQIKEVGPANFILIHPSRFPVIYSEI